jgi:hypothetical protein
MLFARRCDQALRKGRIGQVMRLDRDSGALRPEGEDLEHGSAETADGK